MSAEPVGTLAEVFCEDDVPDDFPCESCEAVATVALSWLAAKGAEDAVVKKVADANRLVRSTGATGTELARALIAAFIESVTE